MMSFIRVISLFLFVFPAIVSFSASAESSKEYYVSIRADEANVRTGPSARYPIKWVFKRQNWPVKVLATFEQWRKIQDRDGQIGWMHEVLLTRKRHAIIQNGDIVKAYRLPIPTAAPTVMLEKDVVAKLIQCKSGWCKIEASAHEAWLEDGFLWGVEKNETYNN